MPDETRRIGASTEGKMLATLRLVEHERYRQGVKLDMNEIPWDCADPCVSSSGKTAVLGEEFGEVCRALIDGSGSSKLREELIQVAAVAVAWAESLMPV